MPFRLKKRRSNASRCGGGQYPPGPTVTPLEDSSKLAPLVEGGVSSKYAGCFESAEEVLRATTAGDLLVGSSCHRWASSARWQCPRPRCACPLPVGATDRAPTAPTAHTAPLIPRTVLLRPRPRTRDLRSTSGRAEVLRSRIPPPHQRSASLALGEGDGVCFAEASTRGWSVADPTRHCVLPSRSLIYTSRECALACASSW